MRPALLLVLAVGCTKGNVIPGDSSDSDTDVIDTDTGPTEDETMEALFEAAHAPPLWWRTVQAWVDVDSTCPAVSVTDSTHWAVEGGGCTDGDTTYDGSIEWLDGTQGMRVGFDGFRVSRPDSDLVYDGGVDVYTSGILQGDYTARTPAGDLVYSYAAVHTTTADDFLDVYVGLQSGSFTTDGTFTAAGFGAFALNETVTHGGTCDREPDGGELDLTGPDDITFTYNGGAICDGCLPFQVGSDPPGEICPW